MSLAYDEQNSSGEKTMRLREHSAVQSKSDMFQVDPRKLRVDENYNVREMRSKETLEHIAMLKASIAQLGVKTPLEVRLGERDQLYVVSGHCRLEATLQAIKEGAEIRAVPCIQEAKGTDEVDRTINLIVSNSGKPLSLLEVAQVVKRLCDWKWEHKAIAEKLGWKSVATVKQHLEALELSEGTKDHIRKGEIAATTARRLAKGVSPEEAEKMIQANLEENKRIIGDKKNRRTKVTKKTLKRDAPKPVPATPVQSHRLEDSPHYQPAEAQAEPQSAPEPESVSQPVSHPQPVAQSGEVRLEPFEGGSGLWIQPTGEVVPGVVEHDRPRSAVVFYPDGIIELIDALAPFAKTVEQNDLSERSDDDVIEVRVGDLKRAWEVYTKATGDDVRSAA